MSRTRVVLAVVTAVGLTLGLLGSASARPGVQGKYGGTLVVGLGGAPGSLDPTVSTGVPQTAIWHTICEQLYDRDAKQNSVPVLAASLPVRSKDKLSYTVQLRQGVRFNDGTPFNAQAVVATVRRFMTHPLSIRANDYTTVESVSASGPYTVVYHLKERDSTFTAGNTAFVLSPTQLDKLGDGFATDPVCVGPFMFDEQAAGDHVTVIKSPYYYDQKDVFLDKIVFKVIANTTAAAAALKAGDIQALDRVDTAEVAGLRQSQGLRVLALPSVGWNAVIINIGNRNGVLNLPYSNVGTPLARSAMLRQAFEEAIDRDTLVRVVYDNLAEPTCTPIPPGNTVWYDAIKVPCTPYDPEHARKLVAESGISNPTVHLLASGTLSLRLAQVIQAQEEVVGIDVVIDAVQGGTLATSITGKFDAALRGLPPNGTDPDRNIYRYLATSGTTNVGGYSNPRLDLILANGLRATEFKARSTLYRAAQQIIHDARPMIFLTTPVIVAAFNANLTGVRLSGDDVLLVENARFK